MAFNGRFGSTDCLPVTGKDGKTVWIFKLEDLREVVPDDVYKVIEAFAGTSEEELREAVVSSKDYEKQSDGYRRMCTNTMNEIFQLLNWVRGCKRLSKELLVSKLNGIYSELYKNL